MINQWYLVTTGYGLLYKENLKNNQMKHAMCFLQTMNGTKRHFWSPKETSLCDHTVLQLDLKQTSTKFGK